MAEALPVQSDPLIGLIDIPLPQSVSLWPQTWASRIAVAMVMALVLVAAWRFVHRRWVNRYRRDALAEVDRIERALAADEAPVGLAGELALLVRRTALAAFPREDVAALSGTTWLSFLDRTYGGVEFSEGVGRILSTAPYDSSSPDAARLRPLLDLVRRWIREHHD